MTSRAVQITYTLMGKNKINHTTNDNSLFNYREPGFGSGSEIRISGWIRIRNPDPEKSESLTSLLHPP